MLTAGKHRLNYRPAIPNTGVAMNRIGTFGLGSAKPIAANTTDEGRKKNRRVELLIHDGQK